MKNLIAAFVGMLLVFTVGSRVLANEGRFDIVGTGVDCKADSVWHEGRYLVMGRCEGLVYPYKTQYEYYSAWAHLVTKDTFVSLRDVDRGFFQSSVGEAFDKIIITAERESSPRKPSAYQVASGSVQQFSFDKSKVIAEEPVATAAPKDATGKTMTVQQKTGSTSTPGTVTAGTVIGKIVTSLLVIVLVVVGIVIAGSLIFRNRGSVSA